MTSPQPHPLSALATVATELVTAQTEVNTPQTLQVVPVQLKFAQQSWSKTTTNRHKALRVYLPNQTDNLDPVGLELASRVGQTDLSTLRAHYLGGRLISNHKERIRHRLRRQMGKNLTGHAQQERQQAVEENLEVDRPVLEALIHRFSETEGLGAIPQTQSPRQWTELAQPLREVQVTRTQLPSQQRQFLVLPEQVNPALARV